MAHFSHIGTDKDGKPILRQWTAAEEARRDAEEAYFAAHKDDPSPKTREQLLEERVAALETKVR